MSEPLTVCVGILTTDRKVKVNFTGIYSSETDSVVTGETEFALSEGGCGVEVNGRLYLTTPVFYPSSPDGDSFEIEGVTIGVEFHWERKENQRFRGAPKVVADSGKLVFINIVNIEEYLKSVISSEMKSTASLNLLRAHAVISRSWLVAQMSRRQHQYRRDGQRGVSDSTSEIVRWWDQEDHRLFDVCADDHCQRYQGVSRIASDRAISAVNDTWGQVLMADGTLCDARFSKCCGGVFERFENCWENEPKSYLVARHDAIDYDRFPDLTIEKNALDWIEGRPEAFCNTSDAKILGQVLNNYDRETSDFFRWEVEYDRDELGRIVAERLGEDLGRIIELVPLSRGTSGRIYRLEIIGEKGSKIIGKELMIRRTLSKSHLLSSAFVMSGDESHIRLRGAGWGHGVGLCQIGAAVMGERGYSYLDILKHYYPGAHVESLY
ncbi:MAG: SpoIID/LytB domain-containing protein [Duncaniella sp.]|nr:SpoIID/LytB domain-containing protein [Duncaniella sp.]